MRATEIGISLTNRPHSDLIRGTAEKSSESRCKRDGSVSARGANGDTGQILLGDETLREASGEGLGEFE